MLQLASPVRHQQCRVIDIGYSDGLDPRSYGRAGEAVIPHDKIRPSPGKHVLHRGSGVRMVRRSTIGHDPDPPRVGDLAIRRGAGEARSSRSNEPLGYSGWSAMSHQGSLLLPSPTEGRRHDRGSGPLKQ